MTGGDEGPSNGRIESEVHQVKRRLRLLIKESGLEEKWWPGVARYVGEERLRHQCRKLGVPSPPLLPIGGRVTVKSKRWHRAGFGPLTPPCRTMTLMGPSPFMTQGYVLFEDGQVQRARVAVSTDPQAERDQPLRRLTGKQPMEPVLLRLPPPRRLPDPGLRSLNDGSGGDGPVLTDVWTGGESMSSSSSPTTSVGVGEGSTGDERVCKECGLQMPKQSMRKLGPCNQCDFCETPMEKAQEGVVDGTMPCDLKDALDLAQHLEEEHWRWKRLWCDLSKEVAVGDEEGRLHGSTLDYMEKNVMALEDMLTEIADGNLTYRAAAMMVAKEEVQSYTVPLAQVRKELKDWTPSLEYEVNSLEKTTRAVRPVQVQGYNEMLVVPSKLVPTVKAPKRSRIVLCGNLVEDTSVKSRAQDADPQTEKGDCGSRQSGRSFEHYASGIDGSSLRCALRKAAQEQWAIGITDVSSAFLLAPRSRRALWSPNLRLS